MGALLDDVDVPRRLHHDLARARLAFDSSDYDQSVRWAREAAATAGRHGLDDQAAQGHLWAGKALTWASQGEAAGDELARGARHRAASGSARDRGRDLALPVDARGQRRRLPHRARARHPGPRDVRRGGRRRGRGHRAGRARPPCSTSRVASPTPAGRWSRRDRCSSAPGTATARRSCSATSARSRQGRASSPRRSGGSTRPWRSPAGSTTPRRSGTNLAVHAEIDAILGRTDEVRRHGREALALARRVRLHSLTANALTDARAGRAPRRPRRPGARAGRRGHRGDARRAVGAGAGVRPGRPRRRAARARTTGRGPDGLRGGRAGVRPARRARDGARGPGQAGPGAARRRRRRRGARGRRRLSSSTWTRPRWWAPRPTTSPPRAGRCWTPPATRVPRPCGRPRCSGCDAGRRPSATTTWRPSTSRGRPRGSCWRERTGRA